MKTVMLSLQALMCTPGIVSVALLYMCCVCAYMCVLFNYYLFINVDMCYVIVFLYIPHTSLLNKPFVLLFSLMYSLLPYSFVHLYTSSYPSLLLPTPSYT